jgi:hypothetical protein
MTTRAGMDLSRQLSTLIPEDAPHEYVGCSPLVELALDQDERRQASI